MTWVSWAAAAGIVPLLSVEGFVVRAILRHYRQSDEAAVED